MNSEYKIRAKALTLHRLVVKYSERGGKLTGVVAPARAHRLTRELLALCKERARHTSFVVPPSVWDIVVNELRRRERADAAPSWYFCYEVVTDIQFLMDVEFTVANRGGLVRFADRDKRILALHEKGSWPRKIERVLNLKHGVATRVLRKHGKLKPPKRKTRTNAPH